VRICALSLGNHTQSHAQAAAEVHRTALALAAIPGLVLGETLGSHHWVALHFGQRNVVQVRLPVTTAR
jgi:hypothetical protein